jgi:hypothetical protein
MPEKNGQEQRLRLEDKMRITDTPTWKTWRSMRKRCNQVNKDGYESYGGRGINICERWNRFENFLADMGCRPDGYTLDRINTDGDYCKENCQWSCKARQQHNRRNTKLDWNKISEMNWMSKEGFTQVLISKHFGITQSDVSRILSGKRWKKEKPVMKSNIIIGGGN